MYSYLVRTAVASLLLEKTHSQKIVKKGKEIHTLAKKLFPKSGIENEQLSNTIMESFKRITKYQEFNPKISKTQYEQAQHNFQESLNKISYTTFVRALKKTHNNVNPSPYMALTPISSKRFLQEPNTPLSILFNPLDRDILRFAIEKKAKYILLADDSLKNDPEFKLKFTQQVRKLALGYTYLDTHSTTLIEGLPEIVLAPHFPKELLKEADFVKQILARDPSLHKHLRHLLPETPDLWLQDVVFFRIEEKLHHVIYFHVTNNTLMLEGNLTTSGTIDDLKTDTLNDYGIDDQNPYFNRIFKQKIPLKSPNIISLFTNTCELTFSQKRLERLFIQEVLQNALGPIKYMELTPPPESLKDPKLSSILGNEELKKCIENLPNNLLLLQRKLGKEILTQIGHHFIIEGREIRTLFTDYLKQLLPENHLDKIFRIYQHTAEEAVEELSQYTGLEFAEMYLKIIHKSS